ncbi:hypothetical protein AB0L13_40825 [Saccharopolyspora shandongensis]|uniref:hypothetical protein n=1 Tax=Saccharopolyspora shandongensis TaxID=418495 RepID=UPI00342D09A3
MRTQPFTVRHIGGAWLCIVLFALTAFLATHVVVGLAPAHSAGVHAGANAANLPSRDCDQSPGDDGTEQHGPADLHCGLSARDISPVPALAAATTDAVAWPSFLRSDRGWVSLTSSSHPALPPSGRQILASSCTSRT